MSWHFLQGSEEVCSAHLPAGFIPCAPSSSTSTPAASSSPGSATDSSPAFRSGMTCAPSTAPLGEGESMSSPAGSLAKTSPAPASALASKVPSQGSGATSPASSKRSSRGSSSSRTRRTSEPMDLTLCSKTLPASGSMQSGKCLEQPTSALRTGGTACGYWVTPVPTSSATAYGYNKGGAAGRVGKVRPSIDSICRGQLPTPTTARNEWSPYMARWSAHLNLHRHLYGRCPLAVREWLMGWPIGWTDKEPLATARWLEWQQQHGPNFWYALIAAASATDDR